MMHLKISSPYIFDYQKHLYLFEQYTSIIEKVEVYDLKGVHKFILDGETLVPDVSMGNRLFDISYVSVTDSEGTLTGINWEKIPLIPLKYNEQEIPLIKKVKILQDGINIMLSDFENNMQEDARNTILVLKNYDGQDLGEFSDILNFYDFLELYPKKGTYWD